MGRLVDLLMVYELSVYTCNNNLEWFYNDYLCCRQRDGALVSQSGL